MKIISKSGDDLCPVAAILSFLAVRSAGSGPLFQFSDGHYLTRNRLVCELRHILAAANDETKAQYSGHSFRVEAATNAALASLDGLLIKKTTRSWESVAYLRYIRISKDQLAAVTAHLNSA